MWKELIVKLGVGSVACKLWGQNTPSAQKFIALHGFMDNANSFDPMMESFINKDRCVACLDFPGHGLSTHLPPGVPYAPHMEQLAMRALIKHLGWTKYTLLGHSMGAIRAAYYMAAWPNDVESVICIDALMVPFDFVTKENEDAYGLFGKQADRFVKLQTHPIPVKEYPSKDAIAAKWETGADGLTITDAYTMMPRGAKRLENGNYVFSRDPNLNVRLNAVTMLPMEYYKTHMCQHSKDCKTLFIRPEDGLYKEMNLPDFHSAGIDGFRELLDDPDIAIEMVNVPGSHYVHMQNPKLINDVINKFLVTNQSQRQSGEASKL